MKLSLNWLRDYVDVDVSVDELCEKMTMLGLEIEAVERPGDEIEKLYVGEILSIEPHPDADKLVVCKTSIGEGEPLQIVCGAKNMKAGDKVPTVIVGGMLPGGFKIGKRKMRGIESQGMMCSAKELGLGEDHDGLYILNADAEVGADAKSVLGLDDVVLEIEVTPNRGDWASMIGVARELAAAYGTAYRRPELEMKEGGEEASAISSVDIQESELCRRYVGRVIRGVKIGPSPAWLAKRLLAAGQRSINNVVDVTNYVMLETGQPLHAFDLDKLHEHRIVVRRAQDGEKFLTLDAEERVLTEDMLMIADGKDSVAIAGCMGGAESEVGEDATNLFIESAFFDPVSVRKTARALNLVTESAQRFQRGVDPEMTLYAANRACMLIQQLAGGEVAPGTLDEYPSAVEQPEITLRFDRTLTLLGTEVPNERQAAYLKSLGFECTHEDSEEITVQVPSWRHDCSQEADLIEEIARLHGYDEVDTALPRVRRREEAFAKDFEPVERLRGRLAASGLTEVVNWTFSSVADVERAQLPAEYASMVELSNPLSENHATMRSSLLPSLLKTVSNNLRRTRRPVHVFELGPVYRPVEGEDLAQEPSRVAVALSGAGDAKHWSRENYPVDFYDIRGQAEEILAFFGADEGAIVERDIGLFEAGAGIAFRERDIGMLGEVAPGVLEAFEIDAPVFVLEMDLMPLLALKSRIPAFEPIPAFPPSLRDLAVVVDAALPAGELVEVARKSGGKHLQTVELFDVYTGKQVAGGKKSVALSLSFQSNERTLTDKDTQKAFDKILKSLGNKFGAKLR